jgi:hypothetical protein
VPAHISGDHRFAADQGAADPAAAAALAAFASGAGSEHAALTALARVRLLVPVVAVTRDPGKRAAGGVSIADDSVTAVSAVTAGSAGETGKASEMSIPTLVGQDGRAAVPAFTCLDALVRWQPGARPVPVMAGNVWQGAVADSRAVVLDIAGPVPLAIDGARLAALASGEAVPLPHEDPDVLAAVTEAIAGQPAIKAARLADGGGTGDLTIELAFSPGRAGSADELARLVGTAVLARLGGRLCRGIQIVIRPPFGD